MDPSINRLSDFLPSKLPEYPELFFRREAQPGSRCEHIGSWGRAAAGLETPRVPRGGAGGAVIDLVSDDK